MFEVIIRKDNQAALQKLMEFLETLDLKIVKPSATVDSKKEAQVKLELPVKEELSSPNEIKERKIVQWGGMEVDITDVKSGFGCAKGMFEMAADFDEPLEDFKEYMY